MAADFTRSLGHEPGVQLNPTLDNSGGLSTNIVEEQTIAGVMRLPRGPIGQAFEVHKGNFYRVTGRPESIRKNPLNISHALLLEAVNKGAKRVLVSRLIGDNAKIKWIVVSKSEDKDTVETDRFKLSFAVQDEKPTSNFLFAIKHLGCFNDGIKLSISAKEVFGEDGSTAIDAKNITLKILDSNDVELDTFVGSLDVTSVDADGYPNDLASIIENFSSDDYEMVIAANATIDKDTMAYGKNLNGIQREVVSEVLNAFVEGNTSYNAQQYNQAVDKLRQSTTDYIQLASFGSESTALCASLAQLAFDKDITFVLDIPGTLTPKQAIAWKKQLGLTGHLLSGLWHPVQCRDPSGVSGLGFFPTSAYRCAMAAARNAQLNSFGLAPKQYPIAGVNYPIQRQSMKQVYTPQEEDLSDLAEAGITPVIYQKYSGGGYFVFNDAITFLGKNTSLLNLTNSVDIVTSIERALSRIAKEFLLFLPMSEAIRKTLELGGKYLEACTSSNWLTPSEELPNAWELTVQANAQRPNDTLNIKCRMHPEGCTRQVIISPEVTR